MATSAPVDWLSSSVRVSEQPQQPGPDRLWCWRSFRQAQLPAYRLDHVITDANAD